MLDEPFRFVDPAQVRPGDVVLDEDDAGIIVDEVQLTADGVRLLGWPDYRHGRGRRRSLGPGVDRVRVAPTFAETLGLRKALLDMANDAAKLHADRAVDSGDLPYEPTYDPDGILLRTSGREWYLRLVELEEVRGEDVDPDPEDGLE